MKTTTKELEKLTTMLNKALAKNSNTRMCLRNGYGQWGLSETTPGTDPESVNLHHGEELRDVTPLMSKKDLANYLRAAYNGATSFR